MSRSRCPLKIFPFYSKSAIVLFSWRKKCCHFCQLVEKCGNLAISFSMNDAKGAGKRWYRVNTGVSLVSGVVCSCRWSIMRLLVTEGRLCFSPFLRRFSLLIFSLVFPSLFAFYLCGCVRLLLSELSGLFFVAPGPATSCVSWHSPVGHVKHQWEMRDGQSGGSFPPSDQKKKGRIEDFVRSSSIRCRSWARGFNSPTST